MKNTNFALIGAAGYVAPRHIRSICDVGCNLLAAADPHDSVGALDQCSLDTNFFHEVESLDRYMEELRRGPESGHIHWVSICSPNYLHTAHIRLALRNGANVICEKPLVVDPANLDMLQSIEAEFGNRVYTVLQLRLHPELKRFKEMLKNKSGVHDVLLTYITARGKWYDASWKGHPEKSGGVGTNIGIHLFDLMLWLFGGLTDYEVHLQEPKKMSGTMYLENARVRWFLSTDASDLRYVENNKSKMVHREISVDGNGIEFSKNFTDLHTEVYRNTLSGRGFDIDTARPSIELAHELRIAKPIIGKTEPHPILRKIRSI